MQSALTSRLLLRICPGLLKSLLLERAVPLGFAGLRVLSDQVSIQAQLLAELL